MTKKKLFDDIRRHPARIYRTPNDVLRDRRFTDSERLEILRAWRDGQEAPEDIDGVIAALEIRLCASGHAAE
ncbi:MAG TPA: hypothetical protein VFI23_04060 [Rhizomicrobium sp.]|nr:hypothetical protein [Rhizomicrobium sp.]